MLKKCVTVFGLVILLTAIPAAIVAQDAKTVLDSAAKALGAENLRTIQYSGAGSNFAVGQSLNPNAPWPRFVVKSYSREIDFNAPASRVQLTRTGGDARGGGGLPLTTDQNQNQVIAPGAPWAQQVDIWLLPQGFIKTAMISNATVNIQPPQHPAGPPAVTVTTEKVADGVFYLMGGSHHSIVVEFKDYIAVIEGPQNEARSLAVIAETKKLIPNKPIKYLINTH